MFLLETQSSQGLTLHCLYHTALSPARANLFPDLPLHESDMALLLLEFATLLSVSSARLIRWSDCGAGLRGS